MGRKLGVRLQQSKTSSAMACFPLFFWPSRSNPSSNYVCNIQKTELLSYGREDYDAESGKSVHENGKKIMVVVDSKVEAKGALEWALSHAVQSSDTIVLLHVDKLSNHGSKERVKMKACEILLHMQNTCQMRKPGVNVEMTLLQGNKSAPLIVEEAKRQRVHLLVLGQRKRSRFHRLVNRWTSWGRRGHHGIVEYCIQNSSCLTIGVRRKSKKLGGYQITTKRHKKFWLLA